jgi:putative flippase GtrA
VPALDSLGCSMIGSSDARSATRFAVVGLTNFVVSFSVFYVCYHYMPGAVQRHAPDGALANLLAYAAGMVNSFVLNRAWTFRATGSTAVQALRFCAVSLSSLAVSTAAMFWFVDVLAYPAIAVWVPLTLVVMTLNYLGCKHWAFAPARLAQRKPT